MPRKKSVWAEFQFLPDETQSLRDALDEWLTAARCQVHPINGGWGKDRNHARPWFLDVSDTDRRSFVRLIELDVGLYVAVLAKQGQKKRGKGRPPIAESRLRFASHVASKIDTVLGLPPSKARLVTRSVLDGEKTGAEALPKRSPLLARVLKIALIAAARHLGKRTAPLEDLSRLVGPAVDYALGGKCRPRGRAAQRARPNSAKSRLDHLLCLPWGKKR